MLITTRCPICRQPGGAPCAECIELFVPLGSVSPVPAGLDALVAAVSYVDAARPLITSLKYRNQRSATTWLADAMVAVLSGGSEATVVTWAPTSASRRRERGFDQSELLAKAVARRLGMPARRLLARRQGAPQTGRSGSQRRIDAPSFGPTRRVVPASVLLVDDVITTGATLGAASAALRSAGARTVVGLVAAATPHWGRPFR